MKKLKLEELGRVSAEEFKNTAKLPVVVLLDNIRSLHNVGSIFRVADAFRLERIVLTGITGIPPHREIHKTALGSTETVAWEYRENAAIAAEELKAAGYRLVIVEQTNESKRLDEVQFAPGEKWCLVFGNEVNGVSESVVDKADLAIEIPQEGTKHSLNVSVCAGIICWELFRQVR
ncbi:MAG: RNA methyltransferase [Bacteroidetes bacterium]|nr:RNA methyltransferase [Bacteroidota bacterium]